LLVTSALLEPEEPSSYRRGRRVFLPAVRALVRLLLADNISSPFESFAEFANKLASRKVGQNIGAAFEVGELIDKLPSLEEVFVRSELFNLQR
jgi:hypothetical protein